MLTSPTELLFSQVIPEQFLTHLIPGFEVLSSLEVIWENTVVK